jgi:hypothetical protein
MESRNWTRGESVVVKPDVTDPDTGRNIGGWQGRISAIFDEMGTLTIQWDSHTLKSTPLTHIAWCEEEGMSWSEMNLSNHEVEPATLEEHLVFPFAATVVGYQRGPVREARSGQGSGHHLPG